MHMLEVTMAVHTAPEKKNGCVHRKGAKPWREGSISSRPLWSRAARRDDTPPLPPPLVHPPPPPPPHPPPALLQAMDSPRLGRHHHSPPPPPPPPRPRRRRRRRRRPLHSRLLQTLAGASARRTCFRSAWTRERPAAAARLTTPKERTDCVFAAANGHFA